MNNPTFHLEGIVRARGEMQDFTGPLSLILMLLSKNKIEIRDLKIADILDQYLEFISNMQEIDLDLASEFVQMASHLVYLKTRTLLAGENEANELEELISSLEQLKCQDSYLRIKAVTGELLTASLQGMLMFPKEPEPLKAQGTNEYAFSHSASELFIALAMVLTRGEKPQAKSSDILVPTRIVYSVREKSLQLINLLKSGRIKTLSELYALSSSRSEVIAAFISVLELCATGNLLVSEKDGEMFISISGDGDIEPSFLSEQELVSDE